MANNRMYLVCSDCRIGKDFTEMDNYSVKLANFDGGEYWVRNPETLADRLAKFLEYHASCAAGNENVFQVEYEETVYKALTAAQQKDGE